VKPTGDWRRRLPAVAIAALVAALALLVLVGADINGSSIGRLSTSTGSDHALVAGKPRGIRSDEFVLTTPNTIGNVRRGLPADTQIGLTTVHLPAEGNIAPTADWTTVFRPQDWAWFVLPIDRAFAYHWWFPVLLSLVTLTWLTSLLGAGRRDSILLGVVATATPAVAWWSLEPALFIGYAGAVAGALICALKAKRNLHTFLWSAATAASAMAFALLLYPPWQVSIAWVTAAVLIGWTVDNHIGWRRIGLVALGVLPLTALGLGIWYAQSAAAIRASAETIYPGHRIAASGGGVFDWLLSAPANFWVTYSHSYSFSGFGTTAAGHRVTANVSEVAGSWFPLAAVAVVAVLVLWSGFGPARTPVRWQGIGLCAVMALLLLWAYVPHLGALGAITLLNRVEGTRVGPALGLAALLLLAVALRPGTSLSRRQIAIGAAVVLVVSLAQAAAVGSLPWAGRAPNFALVAVAILVVSGLWFLALTRYRTAALGLLAVVALAAVAGVNPIYRGLGPLSNDPVIQAAGPVIGHDRTVVIGPTTLGALITSTGAEVLSGLTPYPDPTVWSRLGAGQRTTWNNYIKYAWVNDPAASPVKLTHHSGTTATLSINLCSPDVTFLHISWVVTVDPQSSTCLTLDRTIPTGTLGPVYVYGDSNR